jgi:hypothetical protein
VWKTTERDEQVEESKRRSEKRKDKCNYTVLRTQCSNVFSFVQVVTLSRSHQIVNSPDNLLSFMFFLTSYDTVQSSGFKG